MNDQRLAAARFVNDYFSKFTRDRMVCLSEAVEEAVTVSI